MGVRLEQLQLQSHTFVCRFAAFVGLHCIRIQEITETRERRRHRTEARFIAIKNAPLSADCGKGYALVLAQLRHCRRRRPPIVRLNSEHNATKKK